VDGHACYCGGVSCFQERCGWVSGGVVLALWVADSGVGRGEEDGKCEIAENGGRVGNWIVGEELMVCDVCRTSAVL
jgi:hypothetical protein